jgi:hypothetical protein
VLFETVTCIHDIHNIIAASHQLRIIAGSDKDYYTLQTHHSAIMSNIQDAGIQMAETLQTAHINHSPSVEHDINPSTAASENPPPSASEAADAAAPRLAFRAELPFKHQRREGLEGGDIYHDEGSGLHYL